MFPTGHDTELFAVVHPVVFAETLLTVSPIPVAGTVTAAGKLTATTTCVAVAPLWPDWLKNFVTEIADCPAETKCGAVVSVTQLEAVRLGAVPIVGTLQMFPLAARPC